MKSEIGGYFELDSLNNEFYHNKAIDINTARNCLIYCIKSRKIKKIFIPYYLCDSVDKASEYCEIEYYKIDYNFLPELDKELKEDEYIYIVNYFGLLSNNNITKLKEKYKNVIIDNVQAFFQKPVKGVDTIYSCRKFFGVPDGAYLYTNKIIEEEIEQDSSIERFTHILGRAESSASEYYDEYKKNEELLGKQELKKMSESTKRILSSINYKKVKKVRTQNFKYLNDRLKSINGLKLPNMEGAFAYPLYIKNASKLREILIANKVYVPVLWPNVIEADKDILACEYARNILVLPCDQRYSYNEMEKITSLIMKHI